MTKPDTLASLIAKMEHDIHEGPVPAADEHSEDCTRCKLEAALDALAERWELMAEAFSNPLYTVTKPMDAVKAVRQCAAELRGREPDAER